MYIRFSFNTNECVLNLVGGPTHESLDYQIGLEGNYIKKDYTNYSSFMRGYWISDGNFLMESIMTGFRSYKVNIMFITNGLILK